MRKIRYTLSAGLASRACAYCNNNRKFYAPGQCDIKLSVRSNNRAEQPGLNAGQSLATRDNGADGQPLTFAEHRVPRCLMPVTKRQCNIETFVRKCFTNKSSPGREVSTLTKEWLHCYQEFLGFKSSLLYFFECILRVLR